MQRGSFRLPTPTRLCCQKYAKGIEEKKHHFLLLERGWKWVWYSHCLLLVISNHRARGGDLTWQAGKHQGLYNHLQGDKPMKQWDDNYNHNVISIHSHSMTPSEAIVSGIIASKDTPELPASSQSYRKTHLWPRYVVLAYHLGCGTCDLVLTSSDPNLHLIIL